MKLSMVHITIAAFAMQAQSCVNGKVTNGTQLFDKRDNYCIKINEKVSNINPSFYNEIHMTPCTKSINNNINFNDLNIGLLYFRKSNDTLFYLSSDKMKYSTNWTYSAAPNKFEEQIIHVNKDTIGSVRKIIINDFRVAKLVLSNITFNNNIKIYDFYLKYDSHPSHLASLESFQIRGDGHVKRIIFRQYDGQKFVFE